MADRAAGGFANGIFAARGPRAADFNAFYASVRIPEEHHPKLIMVMRDGGYDRVPDGSPWGDAAKPEKKRLFGLFRRR